jgi:hypothetical protein
LSADGDAVLYLKAIQFSKQVELYRWVDFPIEAPGAATGIGRWDVEGSCTWTHENGAVQRTSLLWYSGSGDIYVYRFGGSMGIGWDVEFWVDETKLRWWLDDLVPRLGGWHHWIGHRYSDSDIGQGRDPEPANKGGYLSRGIAWNTLRAGHEQYAGWEHWSIMTSDNVIDTGLAAVPDRPMMSEDRFRQRESNWPQKDLRSDDAILKEISRWATRGVAAIYGRLFDSRDEGSDPWPNKAAIKAVIEGIRE